MEKSVLKALARIERSLKRTAEAYCNGECDASAFFGERERALRRIKKLLGRSDYIFINSDPRGAMIKIESAGIPYYEAMGFVIHRDWGGCGYFIE